MLLMSVTLEMSKLSGWLNADACCRESKRGMRCGARYTARQAGGGGRPRCKQRAHEAEGMYRNRGEVQAGRNTGEVRAGR